MSSIMANNRDVNGAGPGAPTAGPAAAGSVRASESAARWPLFLGAIVLAFVVYWPTLASVLKRWTGDPTYSHGYLIAAIAGWMVWRAWRRGELEGTRPSWLGLLALALAGLVWLLARGASIQVVQQLMLPALLLGSAWALFGWRGFIALLVPIGVLYFVFPAWDYIRDTLQGLTVVAVGEVLGVLGIPAYIHGYRVDLAAGSFIVVEGCSGLHFFMAGAALAAIQAYLYIGAHWARAVLMAAALLVAVVANWIRVAVVIIAGHLTEMQHFLIEDHYYFGWVAFGLLMIPVLYLGRRLEAAAPPAEAPAPRPRFSFDLPAPFRLPALATLAVLSLPWFVWTAAQQLARVDDPPVLPAAGGEWQLDGEPALDWRPQNPGASVSLGGQYRSGARLVDTWLVYYASQSMGRKLVGYGNALARPEDGRLSGGLAPGEVLLVAGGRKRVIRYRYLVDGQVTSSAALAKLYQLSGNFRGRPSAYGLVYSARCAVDDCADARETLDSFESGMSDQLPGLRTQ